jgi:hypothetical protein
MYTQTDLIEELISGVPTGAEVVLAKTPSGEFVFIWFLNKKHSIRALNPEEGEALAMVYLADVSTLNPFAFSVMETELRKRLIDDVLQTLKSNYKSSLFTLACSS